MTNPTDEELDEMARELCHTGELSMPYRCEISDAIVSIRAQLAEANTRADRAEAALAAQIEVDARIADSYADQDYCALGYPEDGGIAASGTADMIRREIRNQPHDRTTIDQIIADTRAEALRDAADKVDAIIRAADDANLDDRKEGLRDAHNAITRMIPKEGA